MREENGRIQFRGLNASKREKKGGEKTKYILTCEAMVKIHIYSRRRWSGSEV
jgi:hypothetical protein